jgi:hypothetical protein
MSALATLTILATVYGAPTAGLFDYRVQAKESLSELGARGLSPPSAYRQIGALNHIADPDIVPAGKVLKIPYALLRTAPINATLEAFRGAVDIESVGGHAKAVVGAVVTEGSVVETGEGAFARLSLPDGSHIALPSSSRIRFDRLRVVVLTGALDRALTLQKGRAESTVTPMSDPNSRYVIATPVAVTSVRGTLFRTAYDPQDSRLSAGVLKGAVAVTGAKNASLAHVDEGVTATPAGVSPPKALLPAPELLHPEFPQTDDGLHFEIKPVTGAKSYRLTVATDGDIAAPVAEKQFAGSSVELPALPDGPYFAQLSAIAPDGLEGKAAVSSFIRLRNTLKTDAVRKEGDGYLFSWSSAGDAPAVYRFVLRKEGDAGPPLVDETALTTDHYAVKALRPGDYRWQVTVTRRRGAVHTDVYTDPQLLQVQR